MGFRSVSFGIGPSPPRADDIAGFWHGQLLLDCFVYELLGKKRGGYYVDLAANDAVSMSNTKSLERDHAWSGLCVEPNPQYHADLLQHRTCKIAAAAVSDGFGQAFFDFRGGASGSGSGRGVFGGFTRGNTSTSTPVWTVPFSSVLSEHAAPPTIDFLSLDVEGAELKIMSSFPWEAHNVTLLAIERPPTRLVSILHERSYRSICKTSQDVLFAHLPSLLARQQLGEVPQWATQGCHGSGATQFSSSGSKVKMTSCLCRELVLPHSTECQKARKLHTAIRYSGRGIAMASHSG